MGPNPERRVRQRLKSSKNTTFCTRILTFTTQLRLPCAYCISLGHYASNGPNHIENGPNMVEFWLKTVTFWLDRAPPRSGMSTKKKVKKIGFFNKKMKFQEVTRHFRGATGSLSPVSKVNSARIWAQGGHFSFWKILLNSPYPLTNDQTIGTLMRNLCIH